MTVFGPEQTDLPPVQDLDNSPIPVDMPASGSDELIPVEVPPVERSAPIPPEVVDRRATKFKYGLDAILQKSKDEIYGILEKGEEGPLRVQASAEIDQRKREQTEKVINHVIGAKGGPLTPEESFGIQRIIDNMNENTDPMYVLEEGYAKTFMNVIDKMADKNPDSTVAQVRKEAPHVIAALQAGHGERIVKRESLITYKENLEAELKEQGWLGYGFDLVKQALPGYTDYNLRNLADQGVFAGVGLGPNLEETRKRLLRLPNSEMMAEVRRISDELKSGIAGGNPQLAVEFVNSMIGMTVDDVFLKSSILPLDLVGVGVGKMAAKGGRKILENVGWVKEAEKAVADVAKESANPNASKSTIEAAAGDLEAAAVTRTTASNVWQPIGEGRATNVVERSTFQGDTKETTEAIEALSQALRADEAAVAEKPGRYGQEIVNRINESSQGITTRLFDAIRSISKVERLPEIMANEVAVKAILESIRKTYTGLNNSVIHMSKPYSDKIGPNYLVEMHLGNVDGTYFKNKDVAKNFAEFHGLSDATIIEGKDRAFTKDAIKEAKIDKDIAGAQRIIERENKKAADTSLDAEARAKALEQVEMANTYIVDKTAEKNALKQGVTVEQQGFGYYVRVVKPINETDAVVRSFIAETKNTKIPDSPIQRFINGSMFGKLRTPEETLSLAERQNRLTATYTPSVYFEIMRDNAPTLNKILGVSRFSRGRNKKKEFERILSEGQRKKDPDFPDDPAGYYYKSPGELEEEYLRILNRLPDKDEIVAYFEFKRGMEMDRVFRNVAEHRNQQRVGAETHKITTLDDNGVTVSSPEFSGVVRQKLSAADDNILIMGEKAGEARTRSLQNMSKDERADLQRDIDAGSAKLIEVYAPEHKPLTGYEGLTEKERIRYVFARTSESRQLDWNQVPRRGGGHMEYDYDYYIKQAQVTWDEIGKRWWYEGDTTLMPIQVAAMGRNVAKHLNHVRALLAKKDDEAAMAYSNKNLHIDWDTVRGWFIGQKDAEGKMVPPRLSLKEPIQVLRRNESIQTIDKDLERRYAGELAGTVHSNFKNGMKEGSLARQSTVEYTAKRDAFDLITLADEGTKNNPLYKVMQANLVDPITTMNRGLARIAKSNFMDDYKTMAVEHWLKQASKWLEASDKEIWHAPFYHYNEARFKKDAPPEIKQALMTAQVHTQQLTGTPSSTDAMLHSWAQRAYDSMYTNFGPRGLVVDPGWMLPKLKDPFGFARSVAFNFKLGLFNVPQFIVQAGNYTNIYGIAGSKYATPGTLGAQLHFWSTVNSNPAIIKHLDGIASKMNVPGASKWRPGEFEEAWRELNKTGFGNVGSEYVLLDNPMSDKIVEDGGRKFLEWGQFFFKQGERNAKYGAWYTAFKEFRDANPVGRLTEADRAQILQRADLLNLNMSRASSSALHQGIWSIPTQFYTYQIRLMELMTSGRITTAQKARLFATNAAMYGIPMAGGLTGLPVADYIRKRAMDGTYGDRYVVGDSFFPTLLMEGIPAMLGAVITGKGDYQAGTFFDVGSRFGTKGLEFLGGLDRTDKSLMDMAGGAVWSIIKGTWEQSDGFRRAIGGMIYGDPELYSNLTVEDAIDIGKEISSINTAARTYAAATTGRHISKKENYLADTTLAQSLFMAGFGLKDQRITDIQTMTNAVKETAEGEKTVEKQFAQEFRRGLVLMNDDPEQAHKYWERAKKILEWAGYPEDRISDLVHKSLRDDKPLVDKMSEDFYLKRTPDKHKDSGFKAMQRIQELKEKRGEK